MAQAENVQLHHQLEMAQAELRAVYRSRSWRLTAPLRGVVARSKRVYSLIRPAVWFRFQLGVLMLLRRHGLIGFIRRIPGYLQHFPSYWKIQVNILSQTRSVEGWQQLFAPKYLPHPISLHPDLHGNKVPIASSVSVVIPTLNAGVEFFFLLKKLRMQKGLRHIEIVIVDSGSSDNTVALAKASDCKVVEIEPENFSHSHARNLGAMHASGDYLLFMVQDAYPIGEFWIYGLVKFLVEHQADRLAAVSCSEYSRSDSDVMYDSMIQTHYRFLNCLTQDRLGRLVGQDHMSLRSQGQLSDVACLILRKRFIVYGYRNDYAEDLDLGIRLINDGYSVAMLASIKVVHSHNRSAYYYLKRSFVDVIFLVNKFSDFVVPSCNDLIPFLCGYLRTAQIVSDWIAASGGIGGQLAAQNLSDAPHKPDAIIDQWIKAHRTMAARKFSAESWRAPDLKDAALNNFLVQVIEYCKFYETLDHQAVFAQEQSFMDAFIARLDHLNQYIGQLQAHLDERIIGEIEGGIIKTLAATMGGLLGFAYVNRASLPPEQIPFLERLHGQLKAGI
jgi:glycosyltransferase involved in cell wall biosynthesis